MPLGVALGLLASGLALVVFGAWLVRRARRRELPDVPTGPPSQAWAPPPPDPKERLERAVAQACTAAFNGWWRGRRECAACGAQAFFVGPRQNELCVEVRHPTRGRSGFISWTQEIGCSACGWSLSFPHTDAAPLEPERLQRDEAAAVARAWTVGQAGEPAGRLLADAEGVRDEPAPEVDGPGRAALSIVAALVEATRSAIEPGVAPEDVGVVVEHVIRQQMVTRGVSVALERPLSTPRGS